MNAPSNNAFFRDVPETRRPGARRRRGLAPALRATLARTPDGVRLELEPLDLMTALDGPWSQIGPAGADTLLSWVTDPPDPGSPREASGDEIDPAHTLASPAEVVSRLRGAVEPVVATKIDGPVEAGDARAIKTAIDTGASPLAVEIRAVAAITTRGPEGIVLDARSEEDAARFVAAALRAYVAAVTGQSVAAVSTPELPLVLHLLERTGSLTVRPIETELHSTAVDVGVVTCPSGAKAADTALIYDLFARSWHGD
ncbi:MAG: hypothetical protein HKO59_17815 [Phycisphaerales bacterium]|nr:hypothetical protein [Phycisphaerae bacterium]NNF41816.1 hypothetical protein [Phycisphaerales bacterium]NNM27799.1 hypothetical protein [Phycisphaerales bacterium]